MSCLNQSFLGNLQPPSIPNPISFTNRAGDEKIKISIVCSQPGQINSLYRIAASFSQRIPGNNEMGARLLGMPNTEPSWSPFSPINKIEYLKNNEISELKPDILEVIIIIFNSILESAESKKIDLQRNGSNLVIKA